jgi:FSR family fosmidomycin resistance protein-like MFS transporter
MTATALAPGYSWLVGLSLMAGLGAAAYHPQGALNTTLISGQQAGLGMALFMVGGGLGYAVGPVVAATTLATPFGLRALPFLAIPGLAMAWWLFRLLGDVDHERARIMVRRVLPHGTGGRAPIRMFVLVLAAIFMRSWVEMGLITFLPLLYKARGLELTLASQLLFVMLVVESASGLLGGSASDRFDRRWVLALSFLLIGPGILAFLYLPGLPPLAVIAVVGLGIGSTIPVTTVMGQELMPRSLGVASGFVMGLSFVASGVGIYLTGIVADAFGLEAGFLLLTLLPFTGIALSLMLPARPQSSAIAASEPALPAEQA